MRAPLEGDSTPRPHLFGDVQLSLRSLFQKRFERAFRFFAHRLVRRSDFGQVSRRGDRDGQGRGQGEVPTGCRGCRITFALGPLRTGGFVLVHAGVGMGVGRPSSFEDGFKGDRARSPLPLVVQVDIVLRPSCSRKSLPGACPADPYPKHALAPDPLNQSPPPLLEIGERAGPITEFVAGYVHLVPFSLGELVESTLVRPEPDDEEEVLDSVFLVSDKVLKVPESASRTWVDGGLN